MFSLGRGLYGKYWSVKGKVPIWPRRCRISKRILWLEPAYTVSRIITGPGTPEYESFWLAAEEFIAARLREEI